LEDILDKAVATSIQAGVDEAIALGFHIEEFSSRFANNSITVSKRISEEEVTVCLSKGRKRIISSTTDLEKVGSFVRELASILQNLPDSEFSYLNRSSTEFKPNKARFDERLLDATEKIPDLASSAINSALSEGARRVAGTLSISLTNTYIATSTGTKGNDRRSAITLNVRAFLDKGSSGHGIACSSSLSNFHPEEAGSKAGRECKMMRDAKQIEDNLYQVLLSPTVVANLTDFIGLASSAYSVETGSSFLAAKLGKPVANEKITIKDHGFLEGCLGGRDFDDEGIKTSSTTIVERGIAKNYIHNLSTAKRWNTESTGNAGLIAPHPWNLEVGAGDSTFEEMVKEIKRGVIITSNWYTRFNNYQTGEFSTVPRDACLFVENGEIKHGVAGIRLSDRMERLLESISLLSKERAWIEWWEVQTPALCPWILAEGVRLSRAFE
jgi:PmbA protein